MRLDNKPCVQASVSDDPFKALALEEARKLGKRAGRAMNNGDQAGYDVEREHYTRWATLQAAGDAERRRALEVAWIEGYREARA